MSLIFISLLSGFHQQGKPPSLKCFTRGIFQKQPPDAGSCSMQFLILQQAETAQQAEFL